MNHEFIASQNLKFGSFISVFLKENLGCQSREILMPYARLSLGAGVSVPSPEAVATKLTELIASELEKRHELTSVSIENLMKPAWTIGGRVQSAPAHLDVYVTAGTNSIEQKRRFISNVMDYLHTVIPGLAVATYIVIHELPGENWGYDGETQADRTARSRNAA